MIIDIAVTIIKISSSNLLREHDRYPKVLSLLTFDSDKNPPKIFPTILPSKFPGFGAAIFKLPSPEIHQPQTKKYDAGSRFWPFSGHG